MYQRVHPWFAMVFVWLGLMGTAMAADALPKQIQGLQLMAGYEHRPLQGIDSVVGKIVGKNGVTIGYEIGRVPAPDGFRLGGDFSDAAVGMPEAERRWYKEQTIGGEPVHVAYAKNDTLVVTFPKRGANFSCEVADPEQLADVLLMLLSIPERNGK